MGGTIGRPNAALQTLQDTVPNQRISRVALVVDPLPNIKIVSFVGIVVFHYVIPIHYILGPGTTVGRTPGHRPSPNTLFAHPVLALFWYQSVAFAAGVRGQRVLVVVPVVVLLTLDFQRPVLQIGWRAASFHAAGSDGVLPHAVDALHLGLTVEIVALLAGDDRHLGRPLGLVLYDAEVDVVELGALELAVFGAVQESDVADRGLHEQQQ